MRELLTQAEYARRRGVTPAAVSKAVDRCHIPLEGGRLDPLVADTLWKARTDVAQQQRALGQQSHAAEKNGPQPPADGGRAGEDWRARREAAEAKLAELNLLKVAGTLVVWVDVERALARRIAEIGVQFTALPDRAAAELGMNDEHRRRVRTFLRNELAQIQRSVAALTSGDETGHA